MSALGKIFHTTAIKLAALYLAVLTLTSVGMLVYISRDTAAVLKEQTQQTVDAEINGLADQYRIGGIRRLVAVVDARVRQPGASLYLVVDFAGNVLAGNIRELPSVILEEADGQIQRVRYTRSTGPGTHEALIRVYELPGGFRILVGRDLADQHYFRSLLARALRFWLLVVVGLGLVTWVFVSRRVLRRIDAITETGKRIMNGDLSERLPVDGGRDEFDRLATGLNTMLDRIEALMQGLKDVSDNIAHDLKTPLTRMRNRIEAALREAPGADPASREILEATIEDCDQLIRTFDAMLRIARVESGSAQAEMEEVDLRALVAEVVELYEPLAEDQGARLKVGRSDDAVVRGNRELLAQALINLIENALKYGRPADGSDGAITVGIARDDTAVCLAVSDIGQGIAPEDRERATRRFVRLEESRTEPGSGLGLSLVQAVAHMHGGELTLEDAEPGLKVVIRLPVSEA